MIIFLTKSQIALFDAPVHVSGSVRRDGTIVHPHIRIQKISAKRPPSPVQHSLFGDEKPAAAPKKRSKLEAWIEKKGGLRALARVLAGMPEGQQQRIFAEMARVDGKTPAEVAAMFDGLSLSEPEKGGVGDLFVQPKPAAEKEPEKRYAGMTAEEMAVVASRHGHSYEDALKKIKMRPSAWVKVVQDWIAAEATEQRAERKAKRDAAWKPNERQRRLLELVNDTSRFSVENDLPMSRRYKASTEALMRRGILSRIEIPGSGVEYRVNVLPGDLQPDDATSTRESQTVPRDRAAPFGVKAGISKAERRAINAKVVDLVQSGRDTFTEDEKALLRQYSGNGGCGDSLNEFYTDPRVALAMWEALRRLGFESGTALEPSCATGVFLHTAPDGVRATGVELDPISAKVAHALHGDRHEIVTASFERFATTDDRQFDVVIGNPPYGPRGFLAKDDKVGLSTAEQYFVDTALDKCKPGGLVALVVPTGILDSSSNRSFRERMLTKGEFLGALRMPNTAFEHSHTEVTTDVVFLRKRPDDVAGALSTVDQSVLRHLGVWDDEFLAGTYFEGRGAGNVLGTMEAGWRAKAGLGNDITVNGSMQGVPEAIADFQPDPQAAGATALTVRQVLDALGDDEGAKARAVFAAGRRPYANTAKVGDTKVVDGVTYVLQGDPPRWHRVDEFMATTAVADAAPLAAEIERLFNGAAVDRPALEAKVRAYVEKHGIPADNPELMVAASVDKTLYRLIGAVNRQGEISDVVAGRGPRKVEGTFDTIAQSLALETESGDFTAAELAERLGKPIEDVEEQLIADARYAWVGGDRWTTMGAYLTGDLWPKLDAARAALDSAPEALRDKLQMQADRLEKAIDPKSLEDVEIQINSAFLPLHVIEAYFNWRQYESEHANSWTKKNPPVSIKFADGVYEITGGNTWGDTKLLDKYLNRSGVKKDEKPTIDEWNREFKDWLCASTYRDSVEDLYNRKFRGFVAREFSDEPIEVPGLATDREVRSWRWSSLRRSLALGKGIIADDVGLGKTLGGLLLARMAKIQGKASKPIIVVPKSVLANWYAETQAWFPGSRVLTIGANFAYDKNGELVGRDDDASERKRKYHDLTQNDYDFILISEPAFEEVDLSPDLKENYYSQDFWVQRGDKLGNAGDKRRKRIREQFEQAVASREFQGRTDAIYFDQLGVDMLIADEMHHQKNLYAARARFGEQPKFLGGQGLSNRALDFNLKTRWVREKNGGKGVYGLTATPTSNSPLEIYSMLSHVAPEAFENIGIRNSEEFLDRFCEFQNDKILSTSGDIEDALVVSGFKNLDELREIMARFIDRRTAEMVGLKLPKRDDRMHLVEMTPRQQEVYAQLRELAEQAANKDSTGDAHIFSVMDKMTKAALDLELLDPKEHAGAHSPKYAELAKQVKEGLKDGGQIVFSEFVDSHDKIVAALVDAGIPRSRIGVINAKVAGSAVKRQNIADALNNGKLDVVIGNATMAEGLNMQKRTTDIHHLDIPWTPAAIQQRNGRGLRQGNNNAAVRIHSYLSKGSFDGYRYQSVSAKRDWQDLLWNGGDRVENLAREGNVSREEMRIMLSADPEEARRKFEEDKAAAQQRYDAGQRQQVNEVFVRFQDMKRAYAGLKNKNTASAMRLKQKLEATRTSLFNNKYFPAKHALDSDTEVLIEPNTGIALHAGVGVDAEGEGKMVVTGVNTRAGTVTLRRYADTGGAGRVTVPLSELTSGIKTFAFNESEEAAEVGRKLAAAEADKVNNIKSWEDVLQMPPAVLEANHDVIQRRIKEGAKRYAFNMPYGRVPMIHRETGEVKLAESYEHTRLHDTHDYLLPTDANKEKVIRAWMDAERRKVFGQDAFTRRRGGRTEWRNIAEYPDAPYTDRSRNPWSAVLRDLSPKRQSGKTTLATTELLDAAKARFEREQVERIRRATSFKDALAEAYPLAEMPEYAGGDQAKPTWNRRALAVLWARARHEGLLDAPFEDHTPKRSIGQSGVLSPVHKRYAHHRAGYPGEDKTVHGTLRDIAEGSGHKDLAAAMAASGVRHGVGDARDALARLNAQNTMIGPQSHPVFQYDPAVLRTMLDVAERSGLADKLVREAGVAGSGWGILSSGHPQNGHKTVRQAISEALAAADEPRKAAA